MGTSAARKTTGETSESGRGVQRRPQPHGGALNVGGTPGNRGGPGRPPSVLREMARGITAETLPRLRRVALGETVTVTRTDADDNRIDVDVRPSIRESMEAFDRLCDLGMGEELRTEDVRKRLERQAEIICATLDAEHAERVLHAIAEAWQ